MPTSIVFTISIYLKTFIHKFSNFTTTPIIQCIIQCTIQGYNTYKEIYLIIKREVLDNLSLFIITRNESHNQK
jgi:hypothetical protein